MRLFPGFLLLLFVAMAACTPEAGPEQSLTPSEEQLPGFDFGLAAGDFWEFYWITSQLAGLPDPESTSVIGGSIRLELDRPVEIQGKKAFSVQVSGKNLETFPGPKWKFLALQDDQLLGSIDGDSLRLLFDARKGSWRGGGFFTEFSPQARMLVSPATLDNTFLRSSAVAVAHAPGETVCGSIQGEHLCSGEGGLHLQIKEYFKPGIGPLGFFSYFLRSGEAAGQADFQILETKIGLVASSFRGQDGFRPGIPWTYRQDMPKPLAKPITATWSDHIYLFGGVVEAHGMEPLATIYRYDPRNDRWERRQDMPFPLSSDLGSAHVLDDRIYFTAPIDGRMPVYDPAADSWSYGPVLPEGIPGRHVSVRINRTLYFFDQESRPPEEAGTRRRIRVYTLDIDNGNISRDRHPAFPAYAHDLRGAEVFGSHVYLWGDLILPDENYRSGMIRYAMDMPEEANPWSQEVIEPYAFSHAIIGDKLFRVKLDQLLVMDLRLDAANALHVQKWFGGFQPLFPKMASATAVWDQKLFLFGGASTQGAFLPSVEMYDPGKDWKLW